MTTFPEQLGLPSSAIHAFYDEISKQGLPLHSLVLLRHGQVATQAHWAPFPDTHLHPIGNIGHSLISMAVGMCAEEGLFALDDTLASLFPGVLKAPAHPFNAARTVRDLLCMQAGNHGTMDFYQPDRVSAFLNTPPATKPGSLFGYDADAAQVLCKLVEAKAGQPLPKFLDERICQPLGIQIAYTLEDETYSMYMTTTAMATLGQLWLQQGCWQDEQLIPQSYFADAVSAQAVAQGSNRFGYLFHVWSDGFGAVGQGGQLILVLPEYDAVLAVAACMWENHNPLPGLLRGFVLSHAQPKPLIENPEAAEHLHDAVQQLSLALPSGSPYSESFPVFANTQYAFEPNECGITRACILDDLIIRDDGVILGLEWDDAVWSIRAQASEWTMQQIPIAQDDGWARCVWADERTLVCHVALYSLIGSYTFTLHFDDGCMSLSVRTQGSGLPMLDLFETGFAL